jgi:hypothetical protein
MKNKSIKFAVEYDFINLPRPASKYIPDWYKETKTKSFSGQPEHIDLKTLKACIPFLDALNSGYIYELWSDVEVVNNSNGISIHWNMEQFQPISTKPQSSIGKLQIPEGYDETVYSFDHALSAKTPPGYSLLITQPFNRTDLPFYVMTGIIDADKYPMYNGSIPMFLKKEFSGVINRGTPMIQIIPFKRDSWNMVSDDNLLKEANKTKRISKSYFSGWYKKNAWNRKYYNDKA